MNLLCVTANDSYGSYLAKGLEKFGFELVVMKRIEGLEGFTGEVSGVLLTSSFINEGMKLPEKSVLPFFLCVDRSKLVDLANYSFAAVFNRQAEIDEIAATLRFYLNSTRFHLAKEILVCDDLEMNLFNRSVTRAGKKIHLSNKEFQLLEYLMKNPKRVLSRCEILDNVWDHGVCFLTNTIEVHIRNLRKKIDYPFGTRLITTVHCVGYVFG